MGSTILLEEIIDAMEMPEDETAAYFDRQTGRIEVVPDGDPLGDETETTEIAEAIDADTEGRFVALPDQFDIDERRMMERFAHEVEDAAGSAALLESLQRRRPFRSFKDQVNRLGLDRRWYGFRDERYRRIAIAWCELNGIAYREGRSG